MYSIYYNLLIDGFGQPTSGDHKVRANSAGLSPPERLGQQEAQRERIEIIASNCYGVRLTPFALSLSLAQRPGGDRVALSLSFKIIATALLEKFPKWWAVPTLQRLNSVPFIVGCVIARRDAPGPDPAVRWASPQHTLQQ
jgi:hypothetical protein